MSPPFRGSVDHGEEEEKNVQEAKRSDHMNRSWDEESDQRKSQATRLLEFEMWTNSNTLRDLEYTQRRSEKQQRREERWRHYQKRCWKKVYLPAVLGMVAGTFLTLCATLQSLAGDTFLWSVRGTLLVLGPVMLGTGFMALMLAAGCTFKHDHEIRQKPVCGPSEFLDEDLQYRKPSIAQRSGSIITADMPLPEDLDPSKNYAQRRTDWLRPGKVMRTRSVSREDSVSSGGLPALDKIYSSTAMWVRLVSATHGQHQPPSPTCQNGCGHLSSSLTRVQPVQNGGQALECNDKGHDGSRPDLRVARSRSVTSSGYQSASGSIGGAVDYQKSSQSYQCHSHQSQLRHNTRRLPNHGLTSRERGTVETNPKGSEVSKVFESNDICPDRSQLTSRAKLPQQHPSSHKKSAHPLTCSRAQALGRHKETNKCRSGSTANGELHIHVHNQRPLLHQSPSLHVQTR